MAVFEYKARDKFGKLIVGIVEGTSSEVAGSKLKQMGYIPVAIKIKEKEIKVANLFFKKFQKVKSSDLNMFTKQLVTLQKAGLPLLTSLSAIREQTESTILKAVLDDVIRDIEGGLHFSDALAKHSDVFSELYISMVKAGETGGILDDILERLAVVGEEEEQTKLKINAATRYPIMIISALAIGFLVLTTFVVPRFAAIYGQFEVALPLPTRVLIWVNYLISHFWWLILILIVSLVVGFNRFISTDTGRFWWDGLKLKVPIFGPLFTKITMSRFTRITGALSKSGVPILQILGLVSKSVGNVVIARTINGIKDSVNEGRGMSEPMKISGMFPPVVVQMVSAGETTGKVDELLLYVSDYYDSQVDYTIKNLTSLIEPMLIFVLGCGVLFMALGIFLPMWNLMRLFK